MKFRTGIRRALVVAGLAAATLAPSSAHAMYVTPAAGNCGPYGRQVCYGAGQPVPVGLSSLRVTFTCTAVSPLVVDRTGVGCYLVGMTDGLQYAHTGPLFTVGNQSTIANAVVTVPFQAYRLCVGAGYSTATGAYYGVQGYRCL